MEYQMGDKSTFAEASVDEASVDEAERKGFEPSIRFPV